MIELDKTGLTMIKLDLTGLELTWFCSGSDEPLAGHEGDTDDSKFGKSFSILGSEPNGTNVFEF